MQTIKTAIKLLLLVGQVMIRPIAGNSAEPHLQGTAVDQKISCSFDALNLFQILNRNACGIAQRNLVALESEVSYSNALRNRPPHVTIHNFTGTDSELLAEIVRQSPGYSLGARNGIAVIRPTGQGDETPRVQLDREVGELVSLNAGIETAFNRLILKARTSGIKITSPMNEIARNKNRPLADLLPPDDSEPDISARRINLMLKGKPSIRQALDAIIRADPPAFWVTLTKGAEVFVIVQSVHAGAQVGHPTPSASRETPFIRPSSPDSKIKKVPEGYGF